MNNRALMYSMTQRRKFQHTSEDTLLFPLDVDLQFGRDGSTKPITPRAISEAIAGGLPKRNIKKWDEQHMYDFCMNNSLDHVTVHSVFAHADLFPAGSSFLDFLVQDLDRKGAWRYDGGLMKDLLLEMQLTRGVNLELVDRVSVWEIIVGVTPLDEIDRCVKWYQENHKRNQMASPTGLLSLDCEEVPVPAETYELILAGDAGAKFSFPIQIKKGTKCKQLPVKIMIGDGMTWAIMISILVTPGSNGMHSFQIPKVQDNILPFLKSWPTVTGVGVTSDLMEVETIFGAWTGNPGFKMKGFVELGPLAVLAGFNLDLTNMTVLSVQILGGMLTSLSPLVTMSTGDCLGARSPSVSRPTAWPMSSLGTRPPLSCSGCS